MFHVALYNLNEYDQTVTRTLLERFANYTDRKIKISSFSGAYELMNASNMQHLVITDITKNRDNALKIAKNFLEKHVNTKLILISDNLEYYMDGYRIGAHRFFVKPLSDDLFFIELKDIFDDVAKFLTSVRLDETVDDMIAVDSIYYAEADNRNVRFYTDKGTIISKETFSYWHDYFLQSDIILSSRGCLVNLNHVDRIEETDIILTNGLSVPVSRRLRTAVKRRHDRFINGRK